MRMTEIILSRSALLPSLPVLMRFLIYLVFRLCLAIPPASPTLTKCVLFCGLFSHEVLCH